MKVIIGMKAWLHGHILSVKCWKVHAQKVNPINVQDSFYNELDQIKISNK